VLNLFIGIIVDAMQSQHALEQRAEADARDALDREGADDRAAILEELRGLRAEIAELKLLRVGSETPILQ
jgi:voltage-gated sodium channel